MSVLHMQISYGSKAAMDTPKYEAIQSMTIVLMHFIVICMADQRVS